MTPVSADNLRKAVVITCHLDLNIRDYLIVSLWRPVIKGTISLDIRFYVRFFKSKEVRTQEAVFRIRIRIRMDPH
jgi:hypothetical protein